MTRVLYRVARVWLSVFALSTLALGGDRCGLIYIDWELVMALAAGISTLGVLWLEHRRANRLDEFALAFAETLSTKANAGDVTAVLERVVVLETLLATSHQSTLPERVAALETEVEWLSGELGAADTAALRERVAVVETRLDFKPVTHTRRKDGKFAKADELVATCDDPAPKAKT